MHDNEGRQPVLTTHELLRTGPRRGKQHFEVRPGQTQNGFNDRTIGSRRPPRQDKPRAPRLPKPAVFCHDSILRDAKGTELKLTTTDGANLKVKLIDSDRYALLVQVDGRKGIVFKSALETIEFMEEFAKRDNPFAHIGAVEG